MRYRLTQTRSNFQSLLPPHPNRGSRRSTSTVELVRGVERTNRCEYRVCQPILTPPDRYGRSQALIRSSRPRYSSAPGSITHFPSSVYEPGSSRSISPTSVSRAAYPSLFSGHQTPVASPRGSSISYSLAQSTPPSPSSSHYSCLSSQSLHSQGFEQTWNHFGRSGFSRAGPLLGSPGTSGIEVDESRYLLICDVPDYEISLLKEVLLVRCPRSLRIRGLEPH